MAEQFGLGQPEVDGAAVHHDERPVPAFGIELVNGLREQLLPRARFARDQRMQIAQPADAYCPAEQLAHGRAHADNAELAERAPHFFLLEREPRFRICDGRRAGPEFVDEVRPRRVDEHNGAGQQRTAAQSDRPVAEPVRVRDDADTGLREGAHLRQAADVCSRTEVHETNANARSGIERRQRLSVVEK